MVTVRVGAGELMRRLEPAVDREQLAQALDDRVRVDEALGVSSESAKAGDAIAVMTRVAALFPARRIFELAGIDDLLALFDSRDQAAASLKPPT